MKTIKKFNPSLKELNSLIRNKTMPMFNLESKNHQELYLQLYKNLQTQFPNQEIIIQGTSIQIIEHNEFTELCALPILHNIIKTLAQNDIDIIHYSIHEAYMENSTYTITIFIHRIYC